jgi:hypothetical protein
MIHADTDRTWWFHTTLDPHLSESAQRAWYRRLQRRASVRGLAMATLDGVSFVLGVNRPLDTTVRNDLVCWLIDEPQVWAVQLGEMTLVDDAFADAIPMLPVADLWRATGLPRSRLDGYTQETLQDIVRAAIRDRIMRRRYR